MAPEGGESMYILVPVPNNESGLDWNTIGDGFRDKILTFLEEWGLPDLRQHIAVEHRFTPLDFEAQLMSRAGNAFGIEPKLFQTAYFRPHNSSEDVENLFLAGAGTHPGAGVPGVLLSAEATMFAIREKFALGGTDNTLVFSDEKIEHFVQAA